MLSRTMRRAFWCPCVRAVCAARVDVGGVVGGNIARWVVLSEETSTPASAHITIDT